MLIGTMMNIWRTIMKQTKSLSRLLFSICLLITLLLLAACGGTGDGVTDSADTTADTTPEAPDCSHPTSVWVTTTPAGCSKEGTSQKKCTECHAVLESASIAKLAHVEEIIPGKMPTCSEEGLTDGKKCKNCSTLLVNQTAIAKLPHSEQLVPGKDVSCTEDGLTTGKICTVCKETVVAQTVIPKREHLESGWIVDTRPTDSEGSKHTECLYCQTVIKTESIPLTEPEHVHSGTENITPATCMAAGKNELLCSCGEILESTPIKALSHTPISLPGIKPTCNSKGLTEGAVCGVCNTVMSAQTTLAMGAHIEKTALGIAPTCTETGLTDGKQCAHCTAITQVARIIPAMGHAFENNRCTACGIDEPYGVWLTDGLGNPINGAFVKLYQNGEFLGMHRYEGNFLTLDLAQGSYDLELDLALLDTEYTYDTSLCKLTPDNPSAAIRLYRQSEERENYVFVGEPISKDYPAYTLYGDGSYKVTLKPNDYTFFVFLPTSAAIYSVTYENANGLSVGYHGSTFFVQGNDLSDVSEDVNTYKNGISLNVYAGNLGGDFVFSVKSEGETSCILNIKNEGEPGTKLSDTPWTPYLEDQKLVNAQLNTKPTGTYTPLDLTDLTLKAVLNPDDGYYHLGSADGEIIYMDLCKDSMFISSIQTICSNQRMGTYIYDTNGNVLEKRSYNELFHQYGMPRDTTAPDSPICVPLTAKLAEAIQVFGDKNGWWRDGSDSNIFTSKLLGAPYNSTYAWLLYCGVYVE